MIILIIYSPELIVNASSTAAATFVLPWTISAIPAKIGSFAAVDKLSCTAGEILVAPAHNSTPAFARLDIESADDEYGKAWVNGINDIKDLYEKGYFPDNTLTASDSETFELFTSDKAAFLIDGSWKVVVLKKQ